MRACRIMMKVRKRKNASVLMVGSLSEYGKYDVFCTTLNNTDEPDIDRNKHDSRRGDWSRCRCQASQSGTSRRA
jgi:hypothetical protein